MASDAALRAGLISAVEVLRDRFDKAAKDHPHVKVERLTLPGPKVPDITIWAASDTPGVTNAETVAATRDLGLYAAQVAGDLSRLGIALPGGDDDRPANRWMLYVFQEIRAVEERARRSDIGEIYLWTCIDQRTKLMPSFAIGKRSADNARRFMLDVAGRLTWPNPHASDAHAFGKGGIKPIVQISTDGFAGYPEAVDLAFGAYAKFGTIIKEYRNAKMIYAPGEMVGTRRKGVRGIGERQERTICTSHAERLNGTQRLFLKRLNRLTYCFSKKLRNLEAAFAMFAAYYNFCWQTRKPGKSGQKRPTAAMMAGIAGHVWRFDELFDSVLAR